MAVKIPRRGQLDLAEEEQFLREARVAAQLRHPNIVPVHEIGREGDTIYIVSDYISGIPLSDWLIDNQPTYRETAELCKKIAEALHHAHQAGVVHRDLKPSNIMIDDGGEPHIMDFGLAKREVGEITMTAYGAILGTAAYMSPEQAEGQSHFTDRRSDIYPLGVILFQMLTSELPFRGSPPMLIQQVLNDEPPLPSTLNRHVPLDLQTICLKCLEKKRERRFSTAKSLAAELVRYLNHEPIRSRPVSRVERAVRWCRRFPWQAAVVGLVATIATTSPFVATYQYWQRSRIQQQNLELSRTRGQMIQERSNSAVEVAQLSKRTKTLEGQLAPDNPLQRAKMLSSKTMLLEKIYNEHYKTSDSSRGTDNLESKVYKHLAAAMIAKQLGKRARARNHLESARDALLQSKSRDGHQFQFNRQLADCFFQLGQILEEIGADDVAIENVRQALTIYDQLAKSGQQTLHFKIDMAETLLLKGPLEAQDIGVQAGILNLTKAQSLINGVINEWPTDEVVGYDLVRQLVRPGARNDLPARPEHLQ